VVLLNPFGVAIGCFHISFATPPEGFAWTSHSLRKGSASAANAIGVQLPDIRYTGGWSTNSNVLEEKSIDFSMQPTPAAWIFFGWLHKGEPSGDC
jgi:hypothetical protein